MSIQVNVLEAKTQLCRLLDRAEAGHTLAITHASIIRAAVLHILGAPFEAYWRIDIAPLTLTDLRKDQGRWLLRATGVPL